MNIGDIVVVIDSKSIPDRFLGMYGRVTKIEEFKVWVEFVQSKQRGSLSHSAIPNDLRKIGEANF